MNLSRNKISYLDNLDDSIDVDMTSGWKYYLFHQFDSEGIFNFLKSIDNDKIFLVIPLFGTTKSNFDPILQLSQPFLVDNKSNPILIAKFLLEQWKDSGFGLKQDSHIYFSFKIKRVWLSQK